VNLVKDIILTTLTILAAVHAIPTFSLPPLAWGCSIWASAVAQLEPPALVVFVDLQLGEHLVLGAGHRFALLAQLQPERAPFLGLALQPVCLVEARASYKLDR
jgi:hypothetical protein